MDGPGQQFSPPGGGDGNGEDRETVEEVGGAVERIDDPGEVPGARRSRPRVGALLGQVVRSGGESEEDRAGQVL